MDADEGFKATGHRTDMLPRRAGRWVIVQKAVQQYRVLRCFQTLRHMSDGVLVDFDKLQYVCTLGGAHASLLLECRSSSRLMTVQLFASISESISRHVV